MGIQVLKFGGTSVGSLKRIRRVAETVRRQAQTHQVVVVVSAMSGETDRLLELASEFSPHPNQRELDVLLCTGEQKSVALLSMCLEAKQQKARSFLASQVPVQTSSEHTCARIEQIPVDKIKACLAEKAVAVLPGFQGISAEGELTTLGRGGSDTSAVAIAAALEAEACHIFTDVDGVYTTDPNVVPQAKMLSKITYDEMLELASLGAKVLQTRSVEFAKKYEVPLYVRSSFKEVEGTWVVKELSEMESLVVSGITYTKNEAKIVLLGMPDRTGLSAELFGFLGEQGIVVDMIVQNVSQSGTTDISFTLPREDMDRALQMIEKEKSHLGFHQIQGDRHISKVSVVGNGMRSHSGVAGTMFKTLAEKGINIQMISTSEIKISCVVDEKDARQGVQALHHSFGLDG